MVREKDGTKLAEVKFSYSKGRESKKLDPPRSFYSASDGTVSRITWESVLNHSQGWGFHLVIMTDDGETDLYAHIDPASVAVEVAEEVKKGERLGSYADPPNGTAKGPHLHFERRGPDGKPKDPVEHALTVMPNGRITSPFGPRAAPTPGASTNHKGVDMVEMR
jgi:murein DD-endopeptidase MepM/ murein hydrolase activator NlpD